jgi:HAD superfamily hydrolase (TIGR01662 family)
MNEAGSPGALVDVVVPSIGRPSLHQLLDGLLDQRSSTPHVLGRIVVVDDRPGDPGPLDPPRAEGVGTLVEVVRGAALGPAAARNAGWHRCTAPWIVFLDDDVEVGPGWGRQLGADLAHAGRDTVAVQGRLEVPGVHVDGPDDLELGCAQLSGSAFITADMAVRRDALLSIGGFDERFGRAYREDTDLALRLIDAGGRIELGRRVALHPLRTERWTTCVARQRGNADDALMGRLHGADWRERGRAPAGMLHDHQVTAAALALGLLAAFTGRRRTASMLLATWSWRWARFTRRRRHPSRDGLSRTVQLGLTSAVIPPCATAWWIAGCWRARRLAPDGLEDRWSAQIPALVLFDRDGTLVHDVPYNGDPAAVAPVQGAALAVARLRERGVAVGMVTNQSGVARGLIDDDLVRAVNARVEELVGPFDVVQVCPHGVDDGCDCRKPAPGMVLRAARHMGVPPGRCAVVGDIGADVEAARAAGARGVLVPNDLTAPDEVCTAAEVAIDLNTAVDALLGCSGPGSPGPGSELLGSTQPESHEAGS